MFSLVHKLWSPLLQSSIPVNNLKMLLFSSFHYFWSPLLQSSMHVNSLRCRCFVSSLLLVTPVTILHTRKQSQMQLFRQFTTSGHPCYNPPYLWTVSDGGSSHPSSILTFIYFILEWGAVLLKRSQKLRALKRGGGRWAEDDGEASMMLSLSITAELLQRCHYFGKVSVPLKCDRRRRKRYALYTIASAVIKLKTSHNWSKDVEAYTYLFNLLLMICQL
jgi:hypothetical protein